MAILLIGLGWILTVCMLWLTVKNNERLRRAIGNAIVHEAELDATILQLKARVEADQELHANISADLENSQSESDKWQVECAKLRATVERQAGDIVRLETALKTAQRGNAVRASNR